MRLLLHGTAIASIVVLMVVVVVMVVVWNCNCK